MNMEETRLMMILKGVIIGLSIAAPVGPIGVLCMKRTINQGKLYGAASGLGAASADVVYGLIAAVGLTLITEFLLDQQVWIQLVGGIFLIYLGLQSIRTKANHTNEMKERRGLLGAYITTFFLTLTNPMTILSFLGVFAGISSMDTLKGSSLQVVLGIFIGSMLWWVLLTLIVGMIRQSLSAKSMIWINRISGLVLTLFGMISIINVI